MSNLILIDELLRRDHTNLADDDLCYYLAEFTAYKNAAYSKGNQLIYNCKKPMNQQGKPGWSYKAKAIREIGNLLSDCLPAVVDFNITTFVPIPPSKTAPSPNYDDRLLQMLKFGCPPNADIRQLIVANSDMIAAHESGYNRPTIQDLLANYYIDEMLVEGCRNTLVVFDDVITAGNHFKACKIILQEKFPNKNIIGVFIARRIISREDPFAAVAE